MNKIPEEIVKLAETGEVKVKITKPQEVVFAVHKGSYQNLGEVFGKLARWVEENGYEIVGPSVTVCYNDMHTTPEEELTEMLWREKVLISRNVYTKYFRYTTKIEGYRIFVYNAKMEGYAKYEDIPKLGEILVNSSMDKCSTDVIKEYFNDNKF